MHIRLLVPSDAEAFRNLRLRGLRECPSAFASSYEEEVADSLLEISRRLEPKPDGAVLGAFRDGELLGIVGVQREKLKKLSHKAYVWGVYVAPEARKTGIGASLIHRALEHARSGLRVWQVMLGVNTGNTAALALYRKMGFVEYGLERGFLLVEGVLHDEHLMVLDLRNAL
jgi:ribosomal protein S18 acetylase RimI-like enzyme